MKEGENTAGAEHTPLPWYIPKHARFQILAESTSLGDAALAVVYEDERIGRSKQESYANAEFIVRAVNAHDELVDALAQLYAVSDRMEGVSQDYFNKAIADARSALAKSAVEVEA